MLSKIHTAVFVICCFCILPQFSSSQTISELVQEGMTYYHDGEYDEALDLFNYALRIKSLIQRDMPIVSISEEYDAVVSSGYYAGVSRKQYVGVSPVEHVIIHKREFTGISSKYYVSDPMYFQEPNLAVIYNYRARTYLKMGMTGNAFDDFDKILILDPLLSEIYFIKAVAYQNAQEDDVCREIKSAMEMGHISADIYYNMLCNY